MSQQVVLDAKTSSRSNAASSTSSRSCYSLSLPAGTPPCPRSPCGRPSHSELAQWRGRATQVRGGGRSYSTRGPVPGVDELDVPTVVPALLAEAMRPAQRPCSSLDLLRRARREQGRPRRRESNLGEDDTRVCGEPEQWQQPLGARP